MIVNIIIISNISIIVNMKTAANIETPVKKVKQTYKRIKKTLTTNTKEQEKKKRRMLAVARQKQKRQAAAALKQPTELEALEARVNLLEDQLVRQGTIIVALSSRLSALEDNRRGPGEMEFKATPFDLSNLNVVPRSAETKK